MTKRTNKYFTEEGRLEKRGPKTKWVVGKTVWDRASAVYKLRKDALLTQSYLRAKGWRTKIRKWKGGWVVYMA